MGLAASDAHKMNKFLVVGFFVSAGILYAVLGIPGNLGPDKRFQFGAYEFADEESVSKPLPPFSVDALMFGLEDGNEVSTVCAGHACRRVDVVD